MKTSRKQTRRLFFWCFLIVLTFNLEVAVAQNFDLLTPEQQLVNQIENGTATTEQFEDLVKKAEEELKPFFDENFNVDGKFSELKSGDLATDWDDVAKND